MKCPDFNEMNLFDIASLQFNILKNAGICVQAEFEGEIFRAYTVDITEPGCITLKLMKMQQG